MTPQFIMAGSTIIPATFPSFSASARSTSARSLKGTTRTSSAKVWGMPGTCGSVTGCSRGPISSGSGMTENIRESWCP